MEERYNFRKNKEYYGISISILYYARGPAVERDGRGGETLQPSFTRIVSCFES